MSQRSPQATAEHVRDGMLRADAASRALGMQVTAIGPGSATVTMTVRDDMLNGVLTCHGGFIAALADSAFAFACNSYDEMTVAAGFAVDFMAPGRKGDLLTARCIEVSKVGRTGIYDVEVVNQLDQKIAVFRGRSHTFQGKPTVTRA